MPTFRRLDVELVALLRKKIQLDIIFSSVPVAYN
ncbi:unnamed protein product [Amoebophrya sp. A120]|nr:unnamed protein product [Amoebophrya sp. A120]|eukprot:GSA120T00017944001.1